MYSSPIVHYPTAKACMNICQDKYLTIDAILLKVNHIKQMLIPKTHHMPRLNAKMHNGQKEKHVVNVAIMIFHTCFVNHIVRKMFVCILVPVQPCITVIRVCEAVWCLMCRIRYAMYCDGFAVRIAYVRFIICNKCIYMYVISHHFSVETQLSGFRTRKFSQM